MNVLSDVDEIIENEVCNRLIRLSCAKMVNSKHERGGAKLHRNLLILHLLRRARNEQKRSAPHSPDASSSCFESNNVFDEVAVESSHQADDSDNEEVDVERYDKETSQLLDLSCSSRSNIAAIGDPVELTVRDDDELDYSALHLEPLQLPFGTDVIEAEELTELSKPSLLVIPELSPDLCGHLPLTAPDQAELQHCAVGTALVVPTDMETKEHPPMCFVTNEDEHEPSSSSDSEEEDETEDEQSAPQRQRRKRKTSSPRAHAACRAKKCCVEERQLTGLISVFNSGLSVVADQFMAHSQSNTLLQPPTDQLLPSLMRIACNPLICQ